MKWALLSWGLSEVSLELSYHLMKTFCCSFGENSDFTEERRKLAHSMFYSYCASSFASVWQHAWLQRSTTGLFWPQRSDCLSHGQDDPEPPDYTGLDAPQKQTSVCATVNSFTTRSTLLWKLNLRSQIDGVKGINWTSPKAKTCLDIVSV